MKFENWPYKFGNRDVDCDGQAEPWLARGCAPSLVVATSIASLIAPRFPQYLTCKSWLPNCWSIVAVAGTPFLGTPFSWSKVSARVRATKPAAVRERGSAPKRGRHSIQNVYSTECICAAAAWWFDNPHPTVVLYIINIAVILCVRLHFLLHVVLHVGYIPLA